MKQSLLSNPTLHATMGKDFAYDLNWSVTSFKVVLVVKGMEDAPIACQGGSLNDKAKTAIREAPPGTVVNFQGIKASSQAGSRNLDDFSVRIR